MMLKQNRPKQNVLPMAVSALSRGLGFPEMLREQKAKKDFLS
jgi:hypothetical protein